MSTISIVIKNYALRSLDDPTVSNLSSVILVGLWIYTTLAWCRAAVLVMVEQQYDCMIEPCNKRASNSYEKIV
jgi:hypothetical protein